MDKWISDSKNPMTAERMILSLAGMCNHASTWDGAGFSKMDAEFGHSLARQVEDGRPWTVKQASSVLKLIRKYQRQLGGKDVIDEWMENPIFQQAPLDEKAKKSLNESNRRLSSRDYDAVFSFHYDPQIVQSIKTELRGEHRGKKYYPVWDPTSKTWSVPVNETSITSIMDIAERFNFEIEERFVNYVQRVRKKTQESRTMLSLNDGRHVMITGETITISVADAAILEEFEKELQGNTQ